MSDLTDQLLTLLLVYGYPILFVTVLAGSIGLPLPLSALLVAAGGLAAEEELDVVSVLAAVFAAAVTGDCLSYLLARCAGEAVIRQHGARFGLGPARLSAVRGRLAGGAAFAIFVTRWWLTPLSLPVNVGAALIEYPLFSFAGLSLTGEALYTGGYVGIGYYVGESWTAWSEIVSDSSGLLIGLGFVLVAGLAAWFVWSRDARRSNAPAGRE